MKPTPYYSDFLLYYEKASVLQTYNIVSPTGRDPSNPETHVGDPLMDYITIYDCVERRYAGFSNALQQIWYGSKNPKQWQALPEFDGLHRVYTPVEWLFLFLVHRLTGSGASFSHDHGFRNSIIADTVRHADQAGDMKRYILEAMDKGRPIFTSIGNQIPAFPKVPAHAVRFKKQSQYYISEFAPGLVTAMIDWLNDQPSRVTVAEAADFACLWNKEHGCKQFRFVLAAWAMDIGEYFPQWVDPFSRCHYGANALESLNLMFDWEGKPQHDAAMELICEQCIAPHFGEDRGRPYSLEDAACDVVRYHERYVPKGYELLHPDQVDNRSTVAHPVRHASYHRHLARWGMSYDASGGVTTNDADRRRVAEDVLAQGDQEKLKAVLGV